MTTIRVSLLLSDGDLTGLTPPDEGHVLLSQMGIVLSWTDSLSSTSDGASISVLVHPPVFNSLMSFFR